MRRAPARRLARQRRDPAAGARRPGADDPPLPPPRVRARRARRERDADRGRCWSFLARAVRARAATMLVCGGTGSGKTTTLNALSSFIGAGERVVTIEDAAELRLRQPHVVRLEARPPNLEGRGEVTIRRLVRNALRMRPGPDRRRRGPRRRRRSTCSPRCRTGHDGSLCTVHAGSPAEALRRLETLALMADVGLPHAAIREQVADAFDLVVCQARARRRRRRVVAVAEVVRVAGGAGARGRSTRWRDGRADAGARRSADGAGRAAGGGARHARVGADARHDRRGAARGWRPPPASAGGVGGARRRSSGARSPQRSRASSQPRRARRPGGARADARRSGGGSRCWPRRAARRRAGCSAARCSRLRRGAAGPARPSARGARPAAAVPRALAARRAGVARALADALAAGHAVRGALAASRRDGVHGRGRPRARAARARSLALGEPTEAVLERLRRRAARPAWDTIVAAILLQRDAGGDLAGAAARARRRARGRRPPGARRPRGDRPGALHRAARLGLPVGAAALAELAAPGFLRALRRRAAARGAHGARASSSRPPASSRSTGSSGPRARERSLR